MDAQLAVIETVYRERYGRFVRLAHAITGDEQAALDAVHDAFVRAVRHRRSLRDEAAAAGWIARIVINEARRSRPRPVPALQSAVVAEPVEAVREAVRALPE